MLIGTCSDAMVRKMLRRSSHLDAGCAFSYRPFRYNIKAVASNLLPNKAVLAAVAVHNETFLSGVGTIKII